MSQRKFTVESTGPRITSFLDMVIRHGGFDLTFQVTEAGEVHSDFENPDIIVRFRGRDTDLLLANKGEVLLAVEQLTMEMLHMAPDEHSLLQFDANDYRALRIEELRMSASMAAERVKRTRIPYEFSPMTSRERRIIHLALRNEPEVRSESGGMGAHRKVVVYPADMPARPSGPPPITRRRR